MIYVTSDQHFNHAKIIDYENRAFKSVTDMNTTMIDMWNSVVSKRDLVYHLGDFGWGNKEQIKNIVEQLNGDIILIKGNHDRHSCKWYLDAGFISVIDGGVILDGFYLLTHAPMQLNKNMPYANIHGHLHSAKYESKQYVNVCVENWNYKPILFDKIKAMFKEE